MCSCTDTSNYYQYFLADHLGNTRIAFDTPHDTLKVEQQDDYMPFGMEIAQGNAANPKNEYLYNRKELQESTGLYDYGARFYDPVVARWTSVDPLAEISRKLSPYDYVENNPIRLTDPDGMEVSYDSAGNPTYTGGDAANFAWGLKIAGDDTKEKKDKDRAKARAQAAEEKKAQAQQKRVNAALMRAIKAFALVAPMYADPYLGSEADEQATSPSRIKTITWEEFDKIAELEDAGSVVIGKFPEYLDVAERLKATVFNLPNAKMLSESEIWNLNKQFLDLEISKSSKFILAKPIMGIQQQTGYFRQELEYLYSKGYRLNSDGSQMVK